MAARPYVMRARADAAEATRTAILDATIELAYELERVDFSLDQVAQRAGRTVQTILRHFGARDALIEAAVQRGIAQVAEERRAPAGGTRAALRALVAHYERRGRFALRLLALGEEHGAERVTGPGRLLHRAWVEEVFAEAIRAAGADATALTDELVVVTDVSAWKLLRLDRGLPPDAVLARMTSMSQAILAARNHEAHRDLEYGRR